MKQSRQRFAEDLGKIYHTVIDTYILHTAVSTNTGWRLWLWGINPDLNPAHFTATLRCIGQLRTQRRVRLCSWKSVILTLDLFPRESFDP